MARMQTSNFTQSVTPGLRKEYFSSLQSIPMEFRQIMNVINGARPGGSAGSNFFDDLQIASFGTAGIKPQGESITYQDFIEGNTVRYTPAAYAIGARITMEMKQDDLYGIVTAQRIARELGRAMIHQFEVQAMRPINGGFGTTGGTGLTAAGFDSLALFSTAHTLLRGGTDANRATTDQDLGQTALEDAIDTFEETLNESGLPDPRRARLLVAGPQLKWIARELGESELKPFTGNNEVNVLSGEFQYFMSHYLTDADSWFLLGPKGQHDLNTWIRLSPQFETGDDFDTKDMKMSSVGRIASGHGDWRSTYGSQGA